MIPATITQLSRRLHDAQHTLGEAVRERNAIFEETQVFIGLNDSETREQMLALKELGCDIVQGYYFSRPVPPDEFEAFLKA